MLELAMAGLFVSSYLFWPLSFMSWQAWASFALWLVYLVGLVALVVYDLRWMTLPNVIIFPLIGVAFVESAIRYSLMPGGTIVGYGIGITLGVAVLAGLYWLLYLASKGKWVGLGDVKLGIFMGIVLGWQRSLAALFLANIIGCIIVLPGLVMGKLNRKSRVPFGPFLIAAFMVSFLFGDRIIDWYLGLIMLR